MPNSACACAPGVALGTLHIADTETAVSATPEEVRDAFAAVAAERFALAERPGRAGRRGPDRCSHRPQAGPPPRSGHPGPRAAAAARAGRTRPAGRAQAAQQGTKRNRSASSTRTCNRRSGFKCRSTDRPSEPYPNG
jgi:hypothetical protein